MMLIRPAASALILTAFGGRIVGLLLVRAAASPDLDLDEPRDPTKKCKDVISAKKSKGPNRRLSLSVRDTDNKCYCPCCDEASCTVFEASIENEASVNGQGGLCMVSAFDKEKNEASGFSCGGLGEKCFYDRETGALNLNVEDEGEVVCYADCCNEHSAGHFGCSSRRRLQNKISATNERAIIEHEDGVTVKVRTDHPEGLAWIDDHVSDMRARMNEGRVTRAWDPLFKAYFENAKDIDMACDRDGNGGEDNTIACSYRATTACGVDLIRAHAEYHAEIASSIQTSNTHEISMVHAIPESCK